MTVLSWPSVLLREGMVLALPMGKTATIESVPKVGTRFVTFRTEYGSTRVPKTNEVEVEVGFWREVGIMKHGCDHGCKIYERAGLPGIRVGAHSSSYGCNLEPQSLPSDQDLYKIAHSRVAIYGR